MVIKHCPLWLTMMNELLCKNFFALYYKLCLRVVSYLVYFSISYGVPQERLGAVIYFLTVLHFCVVLLESHFG